MSVLPELHLLFDAPTTVDWSKAGPAIAALDPGGDWRAHDGGDVGYALVRRDAQVQIKAVNAVDADVFADALARSFWLRDDEKVAIAGCGFAARITCASQASALDPDAIRQIAKVMTALIGPALVEHGCLGVLNTGVATILPAAALARQLRVLACDEIPIQLWLASEFRSTETDAVSIAIQGLEPFIGYGLETWNAPGTLVEVSERLNGIIRYLLLKGPVIRHGDTFGDDAASIATRGFFSRNEADSSVRALIVEFT